MISVNDLVSPINPLIMALLRSPFHRIASRALLVVSWSGRSSGRNFSIPVGYQRDGDDVIVMLTKPGEKKWWKNFRSPWPADLLIAGRLRTAMGELIPSGSEELGRLVETTIWGTPWMAKQFGLEGFDPTIHRFTANDSSCVSAATVMLRVSATDSGPRENSMSYCPSGRRTVSPSAR